MVFFQEFRDYDKKKALKQASIQVLTSIISLSALDNPSELINFILLAFSDLKAYRFTYWLGVPALIPDSPFLSSPMLRLCDAHFENGCSMSIELHRLLVQHLSAGAPLSQVFGLRVPPHPAPATTESSDDQMQDIQHAQLLTFKEAWEERMEPTVHLVVLDSTADGGGYGWTLRNLLAMLALHAPSTGRPIEDSTVRVIGLRGTTAKKLCK